MSVPGAEALAGRWTSSYCELDTLDNDCADEERGTETQSGSSVCANGFEGRFGFSNAILPSCAFGGDASALADLPFSSHHFCRSELAGGSPGSIASYPMKS